MQCFWKFFVFLFFCFFWSAGIICCLWQTFFFIVGDLNVHSNNSSDPCTAALNVAVGNLSLEQLVNVPTHCHVNTLGWLIMDRATDVLKLTVADMLLSSHFVISFEVIEETWQSVKVMSRDIRSVDMHGFRKHLRNILQSDTQSDSADTLSVYSTCLRQLLGHHAPLNSRTVTDRMSAPWMTLEVKPAKVERRIAEQKWRQPALTILGIFMHPPPQKKKKTHKKQNKKTTTKNNNKKQKQNKNKKNNKTKQKQK